jgi:hypothetical protein
MQVYITGLSRKVSAFFAKLHRKEKQFDKNL